MNKPIVGRGCRMSQLYIEQPKRWRDRKSRLQKRGRVISTSHDGWLIRVKWDDTLQAITYGKACITLNAVLPKF